MQSKRTPATSAYFRRDFEHGSEFLESLRPGERILVSPPGDLGQPPRALSDVEATFISFAPDPEKPLVCWAVVCGIPDGWADEENQQLGLRAISLDQIRDRITDDERVVRLRQRNYSPGDRVMAKGDHYHGVVIAHAPDNEQRAMGWTVAVKLDRKEHGYKVMLFAPEALEPEDA